jgi:predicted metal-dependent hydrolase
MSDIPYTIVRSNRKTLALTVDSNAQLVIRAPMRLSESVIADLVYKKKKWITDKQKQVEDYGAKQSTFILENGENILYFGKSYAVIRKPVDDITLVGTLIEIPEYMKLDDFANWLKAQGVEIIRERVERYAAIMGVEYSALKMSNAQRRWGSCSSKNALNFAWRLVMCPLEVIDYVVVHELSHIIYKNHNTEFWSRVSTVMPKYREAQNWLRLNRKLMEVI